MKNSILRSSMVSPATFYSMIFSATAHTAWLHSSRADISCHNKIVQIQAKGLALSHLKKEIASVKGPISDELLLAMITMAAHSNADLLLPPRRWSRQSSPLTQVYDNEYYGTVTFEPAHIVTLFRALAERGGLRTITLPGLQEAIAMWVNLLIQGS